MKKILISFICLLGAFSISAQTEPDAYNFLHNDINGTARYVGMAGAFSALGGDLSAVKDNPAGLGVYRQSEIAVTVNYEIQNSHATWYENKASDELHKFNFNNFAFVLSGRTRANRNEIYKGLQNSNWIFSYNRLKSFNKNLNIKGGESNSSMTDFLANFTNGLTEGDVMNSPYDDINIPWLSILAYKGDLIKPDGNDVWKSLLLDGEKVKPVYNAAIRGYLDEFSFGWSGNFSNRFFLGATLNLRTIDYTVNSSYGESFGKGEYFLLENYFRTTGSGVNFNLGAIVLPTNHLRLSFSVQTPTFYDLYDYHYADLYGKILYDEEKNVHEATKYADLYYILKDPLKINAGIAYLFGRKGLISAEYNFSDYKRARIKDEYGNANMFDEENTGMKEMLNAVHTMKAGIEFKPVERFSVRLGYAHMTGGTNNNTKKWLRLNTTRTDTEYFGYTGTNYFTAGLGYRQSSWYLDVAVMHKREGMEYNPYNSEVLATAYKASPASINVNNTNILATLGFRF